MDSWLSTSMRDAMGMKIPSHSFKRAPPTEFLEAFVQNHGPPLQANTDLLSTMMMPSYSRYPMR